jgi:predicted dehydrogenase
MPDELPAKSLDPSLAAAGRRYPGDEIPWRQESVPPVAADPDGFYRHVHDHFATALPPAVPIGETREVMRVIERCRASAENAPMPATK